MPGFFWSFLARTIMSCDFLAELFVLVIKRREWFVIVGKMLQVVKEEGWEQLYGGLMPSLVGTAASQVSSF